MSNEFKSTDKPLDFPMMPIFGVDLGERLGELSAGQKQTRIDIQELKAETRSDIQKLRAETKSDIQELRAEIKSDIQELRAETKSDIQELRAETKSDIQELRTEIKSDIQALRAETKSDIQELRAEIKSDINELRAEIKAIDVKFEAKTDKMSYAINRLDERTKAMQNQIIVIGGGTLVAVLAGIVLQFFFK